MNYLKKSSRNEITHLQELSAKHFDLCNTLDLISRGHGYFDVFTFSTSQKNYDKVLRFYTHHHDKLLKFAAYFNKEAQGIVAEGYSHKIDLPNYQTPEAKLTCFFDKEISETGHELSFTAKEFIVLILYAAGCSAKQIASLIYKSENTIETHLYNIRKKTGHADRLSLKKYVIDQGWEGLEKFFFPYIHDVVSA